MTKEEVVNVMDIIIQDKQGTYYDIDTITIRGNDRIQVNIKKRDEDYYD